MIEKLWLTSYSYKTGENQYEEKRLVNAWEHQAAYDSFKKWFAEFYPESELLSLVVHDTIS